MHLSVNMKVHQILLPNISFKKKTSTIPTDALQPHMFSNLKLALNYIRFDENILFTFRIKLQWQSHTFPQLQLHYCMLFNINILQ